MNLNKKAVVLLSGGLDSATVMAIAKDEGYRLFALSFSYGQRHSVELKAAEKISRFFNVEKHLIMNIDLRKFGGSALTDDIDVPKSSLTIDRDNEIPVTYVPARNTIFLSYALAWAEVINSFDIFIGVNSLDYSGYPDCRPEFIEAFEKMSNLATKAGIESSSRIKIRAPLMKLTKSGIIHRGMELGVDYGLTRSCYDPAPNGFACGMCDSCVLRKRGFQEAGIKDPAPYA